LCSEFAGAAEELHNALLINPYDIEGVAETLRQALEMSPGEKAHRMASLQEHLAEHNIYKWLVDVFTALVRIREDKARTALSAMEMPRIASSDVFGDDQAAMSSFPLGEDEA